MKKIALLVLVFLATFSTKAQDMKIKHLPNNSRFADIAGGFYDGKLIYISSRANKERRRSNVNKSGLLYFTTYIGQYRKDGTIARDDYFINEVNEDMFRSDISFTNDDKTVYFTRVSYYDDKFDLSRLKQGNKKIYRATVVDKNTWTDLTSLPFNSDDYSCYGAKVSQDGKKLFFMSDKDDSFGKTDIYMVDILPNGEYSEPVNLGKNVNTGQREMFPFMGRDNVLFFTSDGRKGQGQLDVYKAKMNDDGTFEQAENLGPKFNSPRDDFAYITDEKGRFGYFSSTRKGGKGDADMYTFKIPCDQKIEGYIVDEDTNEPLGNAFVYLMLIDANGEETVLKNIKADTNGKYSFPIDCEENYKIVASKKNYSNGEHFFTTNDVNKENTTQDIKLKTTLCDQVVEGFVKDEKTGAIIANAVVVLKQNGNTLKSVRSDDKGFYSFDIDCNRKYILYTSALDYLDNEQPFESTKENKAALKQDILMEGEPEFVVVREERHIVTKPIYFDFDKSDITPEAALELAKVVRIMEKYPEIRIDLGSHTDSRGPDKYNIKLSAARAKSSREWIVENGISPDRITSTGYGETKLVNKCSNGVRCSDEEHLMNRRTEFVVLE